MPLPGLEPVFPFQEPTQPGGGVWWGWGVFASRSLRLKNWGPSGPPPMFQQSKTEPEKGHRAGSGSYEECRLKPAPFLLGHCLQSACILEGTYRRLDRELICCLNLKP